MRGEGSKAQFERKGENSTEKEIDREIQSIREGH